MEKTKSAQFELSCDISILALSVRTGWPILDYQSTSFARHQIIFCLLSPPDLIQKHNMLLQHYLSLYSAQMISPE